LSSAAPQGEIPADAALPLTGFMPNTTMVNPAGAALRPDGSERLHPDCFEATVSYLFAVGSTGYRSRASEVSIANGRLAHRLDRGQA